MMTNNFKIIHLTIAIAPNQCKVLYSANCKVCYMYWSPWKFKKDKEKCICKVIR